MKKNKIFSLLPFVLSSIFYLLHGFLVGFEILAEFRYVFIPILIVFFTMFLISLFLPEKTFLKIRIAVNIIFIVLFAIIAIWCISMVVINAGNTEGVVLLFIIYMIAPPFILNVIYLIIDIKRKDTLYWEEVRRKYPNTINEISANNEVDSPNLIGGSVN